MDDPEVLRRRLERARARCDAQPPFSPEWDAAMAEIEDLTRRLEGEDRPESKAVHR